MSDFTFSDLTCKVVGWFIKGHPKINSWVARVTGKSHEFSYAREDIPPNGGFRYQQRAGEIPRGEKTWFLPDGVYEFYLVAEDGSPLEIYGRYGRIKQGQLQPLNKEEVVQWVSS